MEREAIVCILGYRRERGEKKSFTVAIQRCLFQARKIITLRWQSKISPTVRDWISTINETLCIERAVYIKRGNLKEFGEMWRLWLEKMGVPE